VDVRFSGHAENFKVPYSNLSRDPGWAYGFLRPVRVNSEKRLSASSRVCVCVCPSVRQAACIRPAPIGQIFVKFGIKDFTKMFPKTTDLIKADNSIWHFTVSGTLQYLALYNIWHLT
jgi:hypothetical protein